jgi:hypothetical protein
VPRPTSGGADAPDAETLAGRATENRYTEDDYTRFFDGLSVSFRGTVAGLDVYPPQPAYDSVWRRRMMDVAYQLLAEIDEDLYERGLDAYAKHWAIYVEKDGPGSPRVRAVRSDRRRRRTRRFKARTTFATPRSTYPSRGRRARTSRWRSKSGT